MRIVEVVTHNEEWSKMFKEEATEINTIFGNEIINIHHIGSTAIPNIKAKPIIDILIEVKVLEQVDEFINGMEQIGYEYKGEFGIVGRRFFIKGGDNRSHHVHIFETGNEEIIRHLAFRDYMIAHPEEAQQYSNLKQTLAKKFPINIEKYIEGKNDYIKEIDNRAKNWMKLKHRYNI
ncbi:GrpB family protein [Bacillus cereus group sp. TH43LC]|uniref:GrpB family protein n=1 Tax=Bacillus TaxID=1386 RepID=UPI000A56B2B7|nr:MULTISPECIES: GrpB family protein [Bacillus]ATI53544.1 GrpB family protein [Bacillus cereus]MBE7141575.1 GrpB family protein [Bacillus paranthracis]MBR9746283.1 GrpB family protein [Bacillus cereus]MCQ6521997.1 GrpB family protein [Bacillus paranthracis]MCU5228304.1 GrpB family protein [Bacillus paranthracis]